MDEATGPTGSGGRRWLTIGLVVLAAALGAGLLVTVGGQDEPSPGPTEVAAPAPPTGTPTGTPTLPAPASPGDGSPDPTATPEALPMPTPGATPTAPSRDPGAPGLVGTAAVTDPQGDLVDETGRPPPEPIPEADLVGVELEADGESLTVTFRLAGAIPASAEALLWSLDLWVDDERVTTITVQQDGTRHVAGVLDWETASQVGPPDPPAVDGATVQVRVPVEMLPRVGDAFRWQALAQAEGAYEDRAPADAPAAFGGER